MLDSATSNLASSNLALYLDIDLNEEVTYLFLYFLVLLFSMLENKTLPDFTFDMQKAHVI